MRSNAPRGCVLAAAAGLLLGCGGPSVRPKDPGAGGGGGTGGVSVERDAAGGAPKDGGFQLPEAGPPAPPPDAPAACTNLQCQQRMCPGNASTTVSGTVYAPNGKLPLYNVAVYVPNAPLEPLSPGMTCDRCGTLASGRPIASALSDHQGKFRITNVPVGKDIPLVIQVGKWRRKVIIPEVKACQDNPLTDPQLTRLPRNRTEGDLPRVALTSGRCDQLTCMIPKLGLDPAEVGVSGQDRAFTFFSGADGDTTGGPPGMMPATSLWNSLDELSKYSMVLFSCPCNEARAARGPPALEAVSRYLNAGGRVFGSHFEYVWLRYSPDAGLAGAFSISAGDLGAPARHARHQLPQGQGAGRLDEVPRPGPAVRPHPDHGHPGRHLLRPAARAGVGAFAWLRHRLRHEPAVRHHQHAGHGARWTSNAAGWRCWMCTSRPMVDRCPVLPATRRRTRWPAAPS